MSSTVSAMLDYARAVTELASSGSSTEATFYPAIQSLLTALLRERGLPFAVRANTSERRAGGGADLPDVAFYDGTGDYAVLLGEIKTPRDEVDDLARSTDRGDQVGRYLVQTGVVLLSNVRSFALLVRDPQHQAPGPVPPEGRRLLEVVELWPSRSALLAGKPMAADAHDRLGELLEIAVTEFATIAEPESLARILARLARRAKAGLPPRFSAAVRPLLDDFGKALGLGFEDEEGEEFLRSSLIQTAFYGMFAGWTLWRQSGSTEPFRWEDLADHLRIPFLGELFHEFRHPTRLRELGLDQHLDRAAQALARVDVDRFFRKFLLQGFAAEGAAGAANTAILYFYEPFLEAFDPELRKQLGVWYTPWEIVHYQVRTVDRLLREELGCARGFADERVVVLDPCCGTGAYLIEVVRCVADELRREGAGALLGAKLLDAFCRRILGFEILTAPFVVAQLQLYLLLADLGVAPDAEHRPAVYLTNALTGWEGSEQLKLNFPELQREHDAARRVKREERIIVILGNPPYNRFAGVPMAEERDLADHYKGIHRDEAGRQVGQSELYTRFGIRKHLLDDLYVRFFRLADKRIGERAEHGVVTFISNSSYLAGRSHPLMRESLLRHFDGVWIDNLNGDKYRTGKVIPQGLPGEGTTDQSIFTTEHDARGIQVGTAITTLLKRGGKAHSAGEAEVFVRDFWGLSRNKRRALLASLGPDVGDSVPEETPEGPRAYRRVQPSEAQQWRFTASSSHGGYEEWPALDEVFDLSIQGVNPNRGLEGSVIDTQHEALAQRMEDYFSDLSNEEIASLHPALFERWAGYEPARVRRELKVTTGYQPERVVPYLVFPLDARFLYYETESRLLNRRRPELWSNLEGNEFLIAVPQPRRLSESRPLVATTLFNLHVHERGSVGFPAHVKPAPRRADLFSSAESGRATANLPEPLWRSLANSWNLDGDRTAEPALTVTRELIHLALAIGNSPQYEIDHAAALGQDWMRVPIPRDRAAVQEIASLGRQVATLLDPSQDATLLLRSLLGPALRLLGVVSSREGVVRDGDLQVTISYFGAAQGGWRERAPRGDEAAGEPLGESTGDLWLNDDVYLANVPAGVWRLELGGYPVVKKWLGYRHVSRRSGRPLTLDELDTLRGIVHRLAALLLLRPKLDSAYELALVDPFTAEQLCTGSTG